jgi:hypothetical protein
MILFSLILLTVSICSYAHFIILTPIIMILVSQIQSLISISLILFLHSTSFLVSTIIPNSISSFELSIYSAISKILIFILLFFIPLIFFMLAFRLTMLLISNLIHFILSLSYFYLIIIILLLHTNNLFHFIQQNFYIFNSEFSLKIHNLLQILFCRYEIIK